MLFGRVVIAAVARAIVDEDVGLEFADHVYGVVAAALELLRNVVPDRHQRTVVRHEFLDLAEQVAVVGVQVRPLAPLAAARAGQGEIGVVPVADGIVGPEADTLPLAGRRHSSTTSRLKGLFIML